MALTINNSLKCSAWVQSQKHQNDLGSFPKQTIQHHCASLTNAGEAEVDWFCEDLQDLQNLLELTTKKDLFIIRDLNAKVGSQEIPGVIGKFGLGIQNEAGQR